MIFFTDPFLFAKQLLLVIKNLKKEQERKKTKGNWQGNSSGLMFYAILVWPATEEEKGGKKPQEKKTTHKQKHKTPAFIFCFFENSINLISSPSSLPAPPQSLFPDKDQAQTTLFPSALTTRAGRHAKLHDHIRCVQEYYNIERKREVT